MKMNSVLGNDGPFDYIQRINFSNYSHAATNLPLTTNCTSRWALSLAAYTTTRMSLFALQGLIVCVVFVAVVVKGFPRMYEEDAVGKCLALNL